MPSWEEVSRVAPALCAAVEQRLTSHRHKVLATLRADGSPRVSALESVLIADGELWIGGMPGTRKFQDLRRDPRFALHSGTQDPPDPPDTAAAGQALDAKISGTATEVTTSDQLPHILRASPPGTFELFRVDVTDVTLLSYGRPADHLVLDTWTLPRGQQRHRLH